MASVTASPQTQLIIPDKFGPGLSAKKVIAVPFSKDMQSTPEGLLVRGKFTSDNKDEVGDIITRAATERAIPRYRQWGNIRYMHQPRPVGKVTRIGLEDGLGWNEVEFLVIDPQARFEVESGLLKALSIGAMIMYDDIDFLEDGGWVINDYSLAEISLVDHPANYDARLDLGEKKLTSEGRMLVRANGLSVIAREAPHMLTNKSEVIMETPAHEAEAVEETKDLAEELAQAVVEEPAEEPVEETAETEEEAPEVLEADEAEEPAEEVAEVPASTDESGNDPEDTPEDDPEDLPEETEPAPVTGIVGREEEGTPSPDPVDEPEEEEDAEDSPAAIEEEDDADSADAPEVEEPAAVEASIDAVGVLAKAVDALTKAVENQGTLIRGLLQRDAANVQPVVENEDTEVEDGAGEEVREPVERASVPETEIPDKETAATIEREIEPVGLRNAIRRRYGLDQDES